MQTLADALRISIDNIPSAFDMYECSRCESIWLDPWLNAEGMYALYGSGHSQHLLGWEIFYRWANEERTSESSLSRARLWRYLEKRIGRIDTFGQLNCPFFGPLLYFHDLEKCDNDKIARVAGAMANIQGTYLHPYSNRSLANRVVSNVRRSFLGAKLVVDEVNTFNPNRTSLFALRRAVQRPAGMARKPGGQDLPAPCYQIPSERYLVFEPSSCFWSTNCSSLGCGCRAVSGTLLKTPTITLSDVRREGKRFDLFCVFNALDHFLEPKKLLNELLDVSRFVFFDTHKSDKAHPFSRQHFYVFGRNALASMADPHWNWVDVSDDVNLKGQNAFILSREEIPGAHEMQSC